MTKRKIYANINGNEQTGYYVWQVVETGDIGENRPHGPMDLFKRGADDEWLYIPYCAHFWTLKDAEEYVNPESFFIDTEVVRL